MQSSSVEGASSFPSECIALVRNWQQAVEAKHYVNVLLRRNKRKSFGLLEHPYSSEIKNNNILLLQKKLYFAGKSGVGKTSTVDKLAGRDIKKNHEETAGIQTHTLYWPFKLKNPEVIVVAQLELWDAGEKSLQKFDHILPACLKSTNGTLLFFSYEDRKSWEDLPRLMSALSVEGSSALQVVVGTHADSLQREVTAAELEEFERRHGVPVLPMDNTDGPRLTSDPSLPDGREGIKEITSFMNALVEAILTHEQKLRSPFIHSLEEACSHLRLSPEADFLS